MTNVCMLNYFSLFLSLVNISAIAAIFPKLDKLSLGNINLFDGPLAISLRASICLSAITVSFVPDSKIALLTSAIASASALAIVSIAFALPSASKS